MPMQLELDPSQLEEDYSVHDDLDMENPIVVFALTCLEH